MMISIRKSAVPECHFQLAHDILGGFNRLFVLCQEDSTPGQEADFQVWNDSDGGTSHMEA